MIRFCKVARCAAQSHIFALLLIAAVGGCSAPEDDSASSRAVVLTRETPTLAKPAPASPTGAADHIPAPSPGAVVPHRDFVDPPLPPELIDDGGLAPLPPRPRASEMAGEMQPTF